MVPVPVEIRRGSRRFDERAPGRATWHSFSFGPSYDPDNLAFGPMLCHDDHWLSEGAGFETHRHSDLVIVTWVLTGSLVHTGSGSGPGSGSTTVGPGSVAVLRAGSGVEHSEVAASPQTRFVQVWLAPDGSGTGGSPDGPSYDVTPAALVPGELTVVARPTAGTTFSVASLMPNDPVTLPDDALQHVFVARGALQRSSLAEPLLAGDAFRITDEPGHLLKAAVPTELLVWGMVPDVIRSEQGVAPTA